MHRLRGWTSIDGQMWRNARRDGRGYRAEEDRFARKEKNFVGKLIRKRCYSFYQDIVVFEILLIIFSRDYFLAIYLVVLLIENSIVFLSDKIYK